MNQHDPIIFSITLIFTGAAALATLALYARQSLLVVYVLLGMLLGPWGAGFVENTDQFEQFAKIGITFLLFLLGLDLHPQELIKTFKGTTPVMLISSVCFFILGAAVGWAFGYSTADTLLIGAAFMFSSTIIGVKLLPTTTLHQRRAGGIMISILLLQDLLAIILLLVLQAGTGMEGGNWSNLWLLATLPLFILLTQLLYRWVLIPLIQRFDTIPEYIFLLTIAWCLGLAHVAAILGFSHEIGAFIAGVALAQSRIALFIVQNLKPLRDFFLIVFFFSIGAGLNLQTAVHILPPAMVLAALALLVKPLVLGSLLKRSGESAETSREIGVRLAQISEFSLLIAVLAAQTAFIGEQAANLIQVSMLLTFIGSSYWIVTHYPTPMSPSDRLRKD